MSHPELLLGMGCRLKNAGLVIPAQAGIPECLCFNHVPPGDNPLRPLLGTRHDDLCQ